jgi:glycosyltransferase involved in cell wall biosynthesis
MRDMASQPSTQNGVLELGGIRRKLQVLHVGKFYPPHMGGMETHLQALCSQLRESVDLQVLVANDDRSGKEETIDGVAVTRLPTRLTLVSTPLCPEMISRIRAHDGEIVHLHMPNPMAVLAYLASGHRGRLVVTYHSDMVRQKVLGPLFEPILHATLRRSTAIIVTSPNYLHTSTVLARHRDRCEVIPLGIPLQSFEHPEDGAVKAIHQQYGNRLVVGVGRLVYYKGFEFLIQAMQQVKGHLLIVGEGPLREKLGALATQIGVADRVTFLGKIDHQSLVACYHAASVFALPSVARSEAYGLVQVEAMAAGLPVVNTQLDSGVPFVSLHEQTGLTVPPGDPDALAAAINRLLDYPDLRAAFGRAARLRAQQEFAVEVMASRTLSLYDRVTRAVPQ